MNRYLIALKYGDEKTKSIIITVILLFLAGLTALIAGTVMQSPLIWMISAFLFIMMAVRIQSVKFGDTKTIIKNMRAKGALPGDVPASELKESDIKKLMVAYKVNREHVPAVIDYYEEKNIHQAPAYVWTANGYLQMLVFGEKTENYAISLVTSGGVVYKPGVQADPSNEYRDLVKPSVINSIFHEYLPTYNENERISGSRYVKNIYEVGKVGFSNKSAANILKLLNQKLNIDAIADPKKYSPYFCEAYRLKILLKDEVIDFKSYKSQISSMLTVMANTDLSEKVFKSDCELMVMANLITREYADYYEDMYEKKANVKKSNKKK